MKKWIQMDLFWKTFSDVVKESLFCNFYQRHNSYQEHNYERAQFKWNQRQFSFLNTKAEIFLFRVNKYPGSTASFRCFDETRL